jgi:hypothetical protein
MLLTSNKLSEWQLLFQRLSMYGGRVHIIGLTGMAVWVG